MKSKKQKKKGENKKILKLIILIVGIVFIGIFTWGRLLIIMNEDFFRGIIIPTIFATFSIGFTGFNIHQNSKFKKIQEDLLLNSLIIGVSGLGSLSYFSIPSMWKNIWGGISLTLFISGLVYFLLILAFSYFMIVSNKK